ncbi:uncharacterized protein F5Z01DRAFT_692194 [Emericellopsis atlantica]|uniref:Uncharacterized protein n=1 Tax=Emericellopsis atlantica TaxID=2614577 RepID=A0A9P8CLW0_9HYPO|nr:uncharacterized protein F5Z01DRAFT_692194 [Emericellopsis atlantica]KAG9251430.1 hypothetical protein F5Z01DRAFT_692194 [Emericellopsis atlantica]
MCYIVETHSLRCDVRPLFSNGEKPIVDTHSTPPPCDCDQDTDIPNALRCPEHGCCMLTQKTIYCNNPEACEFWDCYLYEQRQPTPATLWTQHDAFDGPFLSQQQWDRSDDSDLVMNLEIWGFPVSSTAGPIVSEDEPFHEAYDLYLHYGRELYSLQQKITWCKTLFADLDTICRECEGCVNTHSTVDCPFMTVRAEIMERMYDLDSQGVQAALEQAVHGNFLMSSASVRTPFMGVSRVHDVVEQEDEWDHLVKSALAIVCEG